MIDPLVLLAFLPAALALNFTPGADMLFCLAQGTRGGARPAIAASLGVSTGSMVHVLIAGLGLGYLVAQYPVIFDVIRYFGAVYLVWLAWRTLRSPLGSSDIQAMPTSRAFRDALLVNLANPKVILFILAFLPQFVDPTRPVLPQFLILGAMIAAGGFFINGAVGVFAGSIGQHMVKNPSFERILRWITATIFGALALRLLFEDKRI
ncbi:LysE family translocator [Rhodobacteraceae bacterium]|nr:LysE family translocator [Paracoccaceae bacterium]